jgi:hypothetical protein
VARLAKRIGQTLPVAHRPPVDKHGQVAPQRLAAQPGLRAENRFERFADRARVDLALGRCDMPLNRSGEEDVRHDEGARRKWPPALDV